VRVYPQLILIAVCVALSLGMLALLAGAVGASPLRVILTLLEGGFGSRHALASTIREAVPVVLCALTFLAAYRAGFFNIGAQGQLELGALAAVLVAVHVGGAAWLTIGAALIAAALVGALTAAPALALKAKRGASEVTTTIMLNFAVVEFVLAMVTGPLKDPAQFFGTTRAVPEAARLPGGELHIGVGLALAAALLASLILRRTVFGFDLAAVGGNRDAAAVAGIRVGRTVAIAVLAGAALAGLAGGIQALGIVHRVAEGWSKPWGFLGILAALLGSTPLGVIPAAILVGLLESGGRHMQAMTGVPAAIVYILQSVPVILYLALRAMPFARRPGG
jgi:general nucleoside transport system permease protein